MGTRFKRCNMYLVQIMKKDPNGNIDKMVQKMVLFSIFGAAMFLMN